MTHEDAIEHLQQAEADMYAHEWQAALRRLRAVYEADARSALDPLDDARLLFNLGNCNQALSRLAAADGFYQKCAAALERSVGPADPSLVPCLLNRGCVLVRRHRFAAAVETLRRARTVCDGLLGTPRINLLRSHVLHALATALEAHGAVDEAEGAYRGAITADEEDDRATGGGIHRVRSQPYRAGLAALLQARGDHRGAFELLGQQRATLRKIKDGGASVSETEEAKAAAEASSKAKAAAEELAYTSGRAAVSAFALGRTGPGTAALREAFVLRLQAVNKAEAARASEESLDGLIRRLSALVGDETRPKAQPKARPNSAP